MLPSCSSEPKPGRLPQQRAPRRLQQSKSSYKVSLDFIRAFRPAYLLYSIGRTRIDIDQPPELGHAHYQIRIVGDPKPAEPLTQIDPLSVPKEDVSRLLE
jgi:hypothetical protein